MLKVSKLSIRQNKNKYRKMEKLIQFILNGKIKRRFFLNLVNRELGI